MTKANIARVVPSTLDPAPIYLEGKRRALVEVDLVLLLEAEGDDTVVRIRGRRPLRDIRPIGRLASEWEGRGFVRVHEGYLVNVHCIREIRRRTAGPDWELLMEPPLNAVVPISRSGWRKLRDRLAL